MIVEVVIPSLGATGGDVTVIEWLVDEGAFVTQGQALFVVESDKATHEVEAFREGYLRKILAPAIAYAEKGFPNSPVIAKYLEMNYARFEEYREIITEFDNARATYFKNGPVGAGEIFKNPDLAVKLKKQIMYCMVDSIALYAAEVCDPPKGIMKEIEKLRNIPLRWILEAPAKTPNACLYHELGINKHLNKRIWRKVKHNQNIRRKKTKPMIIDGTRR